MRTAVVIFMTTRDPYYIIWNCTRVHIYMYIYIHICKTIRGVKFYFELNDYYLKLAHRILLCAVYCSNDYKLPKAFNAVHGFGYLDSDILQVHSGIT